MKILLKKLLMILAIAVIACALFALLSFLGYHFCHIKQIDIVNNSNQAHSISLDLGKQNVLEKCKV